MTIYNLHIYVFTYFISLHFKSPQYFKIYFERIALISSSDFPFVSGTKIVIKTVPSKAIAEKIK